MGEWEVQPQRCADCGAHLHAKDEHSKTKRIDQPLHYYKVGEGSALRMICPACWTTARTAPTVKEQSVA